MITESPKNRAMTGGLTKRAPVTRNTKPATDGRPAAPGEVKTRNPFAGRAPSPGPKPAAACLLLFCALCASVAIRARAASFVISNDLPWTVSVAEFSSNAPAGYSVAAAPVILTNRQTASFPTNSVVIIGVARTNAGPPKLFATYQLAAMNGASGYANLSAVESNYYSRATVSLYTTNAP